MTKNTIIRNYARSRIRSGKNAKGINACSFYFFDCDFAAIAKGDVSEYIAFSENISYDLAARMIFAGATEEKVVVIDTDEPGPVFDVLEKTDSEVIYILTNTVHYGLISDYILSHGGTRYE